MFIKREEGKDRRGEIMGGLGGQERGKDATRVWRSLNHFKSLVWGVVLPDFLWPILFHQDPALLWLWLWQLQL